MTDSQIILFIILGLFWLLGYFKLAYHLDDKKENSMHWFALFTIVNGLIIACLIASTLTMNQLQKEVKNKCPELEKVEDVYRIKK